MAYQGLIGALANSKFPLTRFNLVGAIYLEPTCLIQDGSSPSVFRDQEIDILSVLEYTCVKMLWFFRANLRNLIPRNLIWGVFIRMTLICRLE